MTIFTQIPITCRLAGRLLPLFFLLGVVAQSTAQCVLICDQGLNVSLDQTGKALITPLQIAPNADNTCPGPLSVSLFNAQNQPLPNPLSCSHIGLTVRARVRHIASGNACDGTLQVFDALPPTLGNCSDKFIFCNADPSPEAVGIPVASDNCAAQGNIEMEHFDTQTEFGCGTLQNGWQVLKRIDREWIATDQYGNSSGCLQKIWLRHITFSDISFPLNRDNISAPALPCGEDPNDLDLCGQPNVGGVPVGASPECEMGVTYTDQIIQFCPPAGYTVLRNWTAIDFCLGTFINRSQIIKVEDTEAPVLSPPNNLNVGTDGFLCTGTVILPQANFSDNCSSVTVQPSWEFGTGYGPFHGIPLGEHVVTYTATDACNNVSSATMTVTVSDTSPPQAICASNLQISLSSNGSAIIFANTINAGSYDNCGPITFSISRSEELGFFPQIVVNCDDQGAPLPITLKVTDEAGLENLCQMEVTVRDFLKPTVQCPPNLSLHCLQDHQNLGLTGQATASDNCALQSLTHQDVENIQPCNIGSVTRWWIATDSAGNTKSCAQQISLGIINTTTVAFPANVILNNCSGPEALLPVATGAPVISGQSCSPLSVNYSDQVFNGPPPACFRIFRTWKITDHCIYNPNNNFGVWEQVQTITVNDHTAPVLSLPADLTVGADATGCSAWVSLPDASASDCSAQIIISHNSSFANNSQGANASGQYPLGEHLVRFTATDACGNISTQTLRIRVVDDTPPTAVCLPVVAAQIQASGLATLHAASFNGGSSDLCTPPDALMFSVSPSSFDCLGLGFQTVTLSVQDTAGNTATCSAQVLIKDNLHPCSAPQAFNVAGCIRTAAGAPVHNIPVSLKTSGFVEIAACDTLGVFFFNDVPADTAYTLQPYNNANWLNGVTTYDLVLISKHILGIDTLDTPYQMISADANKSGSITTFDIVQLRKLILGLIDSLPNNHSWRFVDSAYVFPNFQNPFAAPFPEKIVFDTLGAHQSGKNFIGLKVGDVNANTDPSQARELAETIWLSTPERRFVAGDVFTLPLSLENWASLEGMQFELKFDRNKLLVEAVVFSQPEVLDASHILLRDGSLRLSWNNASAKARAVGSVLLQLRLRAVTSGNISGSLALQNGRIMPEAYRAASPGNAAMGLRFEGQEASSAAMLHIYPNPTSGLFFVKNPFPKNAVHLRVTDCRGQTLWQQRAVFADTISVEFAETLPAGMYFVELSSTLGMQVGKVIIGKE